MKEIKWFFLKNAKLNDWYVIKKDFKAALTDDVFIDISALGEYILYINDTLISRGPTKSFDFCKFYDSIDISSAIKDGRNIITIFSHKIENGGIYAKVYNENNVICETDESWKIKRYEALYSNTACICPPLEPICRSEEHFDANYDTEILSKNYDYSGWKNAEHINIKKSFIKKCPQWFPKNTVIMPKNVMCVTALRKESGYGMRLVSEVREKNETTKCAYELYACEVISKTGFSANSISKGTLYVNGIKAEKEVNIKEGKNLFVIHYNDGADAEIFITTEEKLQFSDWYVYNLDSNEKFYAWNYVSDIFLGTDTREYVESITKKTEFSQLGDRFFSNMKAVFVCENSIGVDLKSYSYGEFEKSFSYPDFKIPVSYNDDFCDINNTELMLNQNIGYAKLRGNVHFILDFGVEVLGYIKFKIFAKKGTVIDFQGFEIAGDDGIVHMEKNCMRYICRDGWQEFISFLPRGFRYLGVYVFGGNETTKIEYIGLEDITASVPCNGDFRCDDDFLNEAYKMSINTAKVCMSDTYVDCPGYEQVYWVGDAIVTSHVNLLNFGGYSYDAKCLELFGITIEDDYKEMYKKDDENYLKNKYLVLAAHGTYVKGGIPEFSFMWALSVYNNYLYSGDKDMMKHLFSYVKKMLENCGNMMSERGLFSCDGAWNLIEWAENDLLMCGEVTASSAWLYKLYKLYSGVAKELGEDILSEKYLLLAENLKEAINKYCWNSEANAYSDSVRDGYGYELYLSYFSKNNIPAVSYEVFKKYERISDHTNIICYICDLVPKERIPYVEKIITRIESEDYTFYKSSPVNNTKKVNSGIYHDINDITSIGSPYFLYYVFEALFKMGHVKQVLDIIRRAYKEIVDLGSNTCWETFYNKKTDEFTRSIAHGWGASPAVYLITDICGIKPLKPGFSEFLFNPQLSYLNKVKASIPTPYGKIYVDIDKTNGKKDIIYPEKCKIIQGEIK